MSRKSLRIFWLLVITCLTTTYGNETDEHEHDHDHDHDHNGFYHLIEVITGAHGHTLDHHSVELLFESLEMRFHLHDAHSCIESIHELTPHQEEYNETTFFDTAHRTLHYLMDGNCTAALETNNLIFDDTPVCQQYVSGTLRDLEVYYEVFTTEECFNEFTLLHENCTNENSDLVYMMLADLYQGKCILPDSHYFEDELFEHLGVEGDVVTEENFATLLESLQIAGHTEESHDEEAGHDHDHDHEHVRRKKRQADETDHDHDHDHEHEHSNETDTHQHEVCYSDYQLRSIFGLYGNLTRDEVLAMCPAFLQQVIGGACISTTTEETETCASAEGYTMAMKYGYGTAAVAIISSLAFVGMVFFPVLKTNGFRLVMQFFIALGVGTLSGDAIFHILPDIVGLHSHEPCAHNHDHGSEVPDYTWKLVVVVAAIWVLFMFENGLKLFSTSYKHSHSHSHSPDPSKVYENTAYDGNDDPKQQNEKGANFHSSNLDDLSIQSSQSSGQTESESNEKTTYFWGITTTGIMVLIGDVLHNFGDGIAIGAAFSISWPQGVGTSLAVLFHELPHEFGDFAIYLNNGLSKCRALLLNFAAACFCFLGLYIALALSEDPGVRVWLLSFVAGNFIYVSFVNVMHELVEEKTKSPVLQFFLQNLGLFLGWTILLLLAIYEEQLINSIS